MVAIDAGAEDISVDDDVFEIVAEPGDLAAVRAALDEAGIAIESAEVVWLPKTRVPLDEEQAGKLLRLIDALEENDDVNAVHATSTWTPKSSNASLADAATLRRQRRCIKHFRRSRQYEAEEHHSNGNRNREVVQRREGVRVHHARRPR